MDKKKVLRENRENKILNYGMDFLIFLVEKMKKGDDSKEFAPLYSDKPSSMAIPSKHKDQSEKKMEIKPQKTDQEVMRQKEHRKIMAELHKKAFLKNKEEIQIQLRKSRKTTFSLQEASQVDENNESTESEKSSQEEKRKATEKKG